MCDNDPHVYQACGHGSNTTITNTDVLCGGLFCNNKYMRCIKNCSVDKNCPVSQINRTPDLQEYTVTTASYTTSNTVREYPATELCNDKCDDTICIDESDCNGYKYGVNCTDDGRNRYCPVKWICKGYSFCDKGEDEQDCNVTETHTSYHLHSPAASSRATSTNDKIGTGNNY